MFRINSQQYEYHAFSQTKGSVKCVVKRQNDGSERDSRASKSSYYRSNESKAKRVEFTYDRPVRNEDSDDQT